MTPSTQRLTEDVFGGAVDSAGRKFLTTGPIDRPHYGSVVTGSTNDAEWKRLMHDWYGLTPVPGWNWDAWADCPHRIVKARHDHRRYRNSTCEWYLRWGWPLWDHARAWRNAEGELVITLEPYANPFDLTRRFAALEAELDDLGIVTAFEGRSPYGASFILFLMADDTDAGRRARAVQRVGRYFADDLGVNG